MPPKPIQVLLQLWTGPGTDGLTASHPCTYIYILCLSQEYAGLVNINQRWGRGYLMLLGPTLNPWGHELLENAPASLTSGGTVLGHVLHVFSGGLCWDWVSVACNSNLLLDFLPSLTYFPHFLTCVSWAGSPKRRACKFSLWRKPQHSTFLKKWVHSSLKWTKS